MKISYMPKNRKRSFTLIEALIATALLTMLLISFLGSLWVSFDYLRRVMELRTAALVLQEQVSIIRNKKFSEIILLGDSFTSSGMLSLNDAAGTIIKSYYGGQNKMLKITFKLDWNMFNGTPVSKTVVTVITDHGIDKR